MEYDGRILNPTEEEFNRWLSTQTMRGTIGGGRLSDLAQEQPMQPMNTIRNNATGRVIDMNYATKPLRDLTEADQQAAIEATGGRRTNYDVHIDGPREVARRQLPDGRTEVIREYPALQPTVDGRLNQSSKLVREIETPAYLNPNETKRLQFEKLTGEARKANITPEQEAKREALIESEKAKTPGTEAYKRLQGEKQAEQKAAQKLKVFEAKSRLVKEKVDEALLDAGRLSTGIIGQMTRGVGETPAFNLQQTVATVKANIGFDELQKMRDNSPTGGALGQVAIQELERLEATLGSLDTAQSEEKLRANLKAVKTHYNNWLNIMREADKSGNAPSMPEAPVQQQQEPKRGMIKGGYLYKGGDPSNPESWMKVK